MPIASKIFRYLITPFITLIILGVVVVAAIYFYYTPQIPSVDELKNTQLQLPLRVYSKDNQLIAEFGQYRRRPVKYQQIPENLRNAFIAIEDARFYQHKGVDFRGIARAVVSALKTGHVRQGASTITMQVARNFYLSNERTLDRKLREALLAMKIEKSLSKEQILELYLNKIFLGKRAYGVGSAAEIYYGKKVQELTLAQSAMIAGLPKAPSRFNPVINPKRAKQRRDYILQRMLQLHYINTDQYQLAIKEPLTAKVHQVETQAYAPYMAEMARADAIKRFGEANIYKLGLKIYTTLDSKAQHNAITTLRKHLIKYTRRHGYRGAEDKIPLAKLKSTYKSPRDRQKLLKGYKVYAKLYPALVIKSTKKEAILTVLGQKQPIKLGLKQIKWARPYINENRRGKTPKYVSQVLKTGDIVRVSQDSKGKWQLTQLPKVTGALVSMNPKDGAIEAIAGGFDFRYSKFNRAIQAKRQPGSSFKPFVYAAALAKGFSPASTILNEPIEIPGSTWKPQNYGHDYGGPIRLRVALAKSKNLPSIRLLQEVGLGHTIEYARQFGFTDETLPKDLTLALGTGSATPLQMATAYSSFANGGYKVNSYFIRKIEDRTGQVIYQAEPETACENCDPLLGKQDNNKTSVKHPAKRIMAPHVHYQITSMLQSVTQMGTAARASAMLGRHDLAGKTGTTDDQKDAWFCGFTPDLVTVVWVGFDHIKPLGRHETAAGAALPIWIDYMKTALKGHKQKRWKVPRGMISVELDAETGMPPNAYTFETVNELLVQSQIPTEEEVYEYMQAHREELDEKQRMLQLEDANRAAAIRQQERLRREAMQREANQRRRAIARQRELDRRAGRPLTPWPQPQQQPPVPRRATQQRPIHRTTPRQAPARRPGRVEIPEQLF
jgi:penicillin-binding protein 1A